MQPAWGAKPLIHMWGLSSLATYASEPHNFSRKTLCGALTDHCVTPVLVCLGVPTHTVSINAIFLGLFAWEPGSRPHARSKAHMWPVWHQRSN